MSQGRSSSFTGLPRELFAMGSKKSVLKAASSGRSFAGKRQLSLGKDDIEKKLPLDQAQKFNVFERKEITLSIGDRVRFTKNSKHQGHKFLNNELRTVVSIDQGTIVFDFSVSFPKVINRAESHGKGNVGFLILDYSPNQALRI
jgi:plastocyanin